MSCTFQTNCINSGNICSVNSLGKGDGPNVVMAVNKSIADYQNSKSESKIKIKELTAWTTGSVLGVVKTCRMNGSAVWHKAA